MFPIFILLISSFITFWPKYVTYRVDHSDVLSLQICERNVIKIW